MILFIVHMALFTYFGIAVMYTLILSCAGRLFKAPDMDLRQIHFYRIAIFIPAYQEDQVILHSVNKMLKLKYPPQAYRIFVLADQLKSRTLFELRKLPVDLIEINLKKSSKAGALNQALSQKTVEDYEIAVISDADNIFKGDFLLEINKAFHQGLQVVQGKRIAKNDNSDFAILDGTSEQINNHLFRKGCNVLGLSASFIGSGFAMEMGLFKSCMSTVRAMGGFDRVLQLKVLERGYFIHYLPSALCFDEKISQGKTFGNQRRRWLSSQFIYLGHYFSKGIRAFLRGEFDYFHLAVFNNLFLPRLMNLGLLILASIAWVLFDRSFASLNFYWIILLFAYSMALGLALPKGLAILPMLKAMMKLPEAFLRMFLLFFKLKGADKEFIHTPHSSGAIDNSIYLDHEKA